MDQYYIEAQIREITRQVGTINAGRRALAANSKSAMTPVARLEPATLAQKAGIHENPFNAAQSTRIG